MRVLVLNAGSATLKATVLDLPDRAPRFDRTVDWAADASDADREVAVRSILGAIARAGIPAASIGVVGYRVVHGGTRFTGPVIIDDETAAAIDELADLAPLHNPLAAATIRAARASLPSLPHVAAFDTAFHASLPEAARRYPLPDRWLEQWGVRRYGFHGLSVTWSIRRASELLDRPVADLRVVVAHLGGGCSVTAVDGGRSVDTSMGLTPLEGLMMATRAGSIDPGAIIRALRLGEPLDEVAADLEHRSGLLGVSARTADMRELLELEATGDLRARLAIEMFVRRAAAGIAAAATSLPALDALVFTGGIGENAGSIRRRIVGRLAVLQLAEEATPGEQANVDTVLNAGPPAVLRVRAREDVVIAEAAAGIPG
jgi:acetate kinase